MRLALKGSLFQSLWMCVAEMGLGYLEEGFLYWGFLLESYEEEKREEGEDSAIMYLRGP